MQELERNLGIEFLKEVKKIKTQQLESELQEIVLANQEGSIFECPFCHYIGQKRNKQGTAKVMRGEGNSLTFKCFNCNVWRKI